METLLTPRQQAAQYKLEQEADDAVHLLKKSGMSDDDIATAAALNYHHNPTPLNQAIMVLADARVVTLYESLALQETWQREEKEEKEWRMRY